MVTIVTEVHESKSMKAIIKNGSYRILIRARTVDLT